MSDGSLAPQITAVLATLQFELFVGSPPFGFLLGTITCKLSAQFFFTTHLSLLGRRRFFLLDRACCVMLSGAVQCSR